MLGNIERINPGARSACEDDRNGGYFAAKDLRCYGVLSDQRAYSLHGLNASIVAKLAPSPNAHPILAVNAKTGISYSQQGRNSCFDAVQESSGLE